MSLFTRRRAEQTAASEAPLIRCSLYQEGRMLVHKHLFLVVPRVGELVCVLEEGQEIMYRVLQVTHVAAGAWRDDAAPTPEIQIEVTRKPAPVAGIDV